MMSMQWAGTDRCDARDCAHEPFFTPRGLRLTPRGSWGETLLDQADQALCCCVVQARRRPDRAHSQLATAGRSSNSGGDRSHVMVKRKDKSHGSSITSHPSVLGRCLRCRSRRAHRLHEGRLGCDARCCFGRYRNCRELRRADHRQQVMISSTIVGAGWPTDRARTMPSVAAPSAVAFVPVIASADSSVDVSFAFN